MISELKDDEILDFLMTSDLEDNYSPEELKYLIFKWRYFYRILHSSKERDKDDLIGKVSRLDDKIKELQSEKNSILVEKANIENKLNGIKGKSLSWKERLTGKIILNENENI